ncbi:uncharacterized protein Z518_07576 [Rhinocladiella mackenziei CBS 650.93]|uniref:Uncharacterized protein n=1 Tax=Rhinocladiella mackenziei CBS 650.93 TaxID=1442369 RepID=A0A0D2H0T4_9EURO|nr:uncharacterized protein Z518_07576 [Rhinocladiella mackenziei CBS 650.93]KIX04023.1 hypothetical protein Z518_07576 [Rhinocladiella mackenziei CBS 650.93]
MGNTFSQIFFIPKPTLTEKNLADQTGKVFIVTGGNTGVGYELCKILYTHNATVYLAGRSEERCKKAIESIISASPSKAGVIKFLKLDLADLTTIKGSAEEFLRQEKRLDWLCNNAGVMRAPAGSKGAQGYELHMTTNCLGPWLLTQFLHPILAATAATSLPNSVRVSWAGSLVIDLYAPHGGMTLTGQGEPDLSSANPRTLYAVSKAGNLFYASEYGKRCKADGIVSTCFNPGNLKTELQRYMSASETVTHRLILFPAILGAYTELWSGFAPELTTEWNGTYIAPWGRILHVKKDRMQSLKTCDEGGNGKAKAFWDWTEKECKKYM